MMNISSMLLLLPIHNTLSFLLAATFIEGAVLETSHHHPSAFLFRRPPSLHSESSLSSTATSPSIRGGKLHMGGIRSTDAAHSPRPTGLFLSSGSGFGNKKSQSPSTSSSSSTSPSNNELFELQELRAQLQTILKQNISYQSLSKEKREELTKYVLAIIDKTESPINVSGRDGNTMGIAKFVVGIENKSWRMVFTTHSSDGGDNSASLPAGSTVILRVGEFLGMQGKLDYVLKYGERILGLNELVAKSTCSVDIGPINPGLLTFQYEDIKSNIFGVSNVPVGFFGLLKGRVNCIDTIWFDGERWIERNYAENGDVVYSVYVRDVEDEAR